MNKFRIWLLRMLIGNTPVIANVSFIRPTRISDKLFPIVWNCSTKNVPWQDRLGGDRA